MNGHGINPVQVSPARLVCSLGHKVTCMLCVSPLPTTTTTTGAPPPQLLTAAELLLLGTVATVLLGFLAFAVMIASILCYQRCHKSSKSAKRDPLSSLSHSTQHPNTAPHHWPSLSLQQPTSFLHNPHIHEDERYQSKTEVLTWQTSLPEKHQ